MNTAAQLDDGAPSWRDIAEQLRTLEGQPLEDLLDALELLDVGPGLSAAAWLPYHWPAWAAPHQLLPEEDDWFTLVLRAGRGGGKTCAGTEGTRAKVNSWEGPGVGHIALIAPVYAEIEEIMVNGPSGLKTRAPPWDLPEWRPGKGHGGQLWWHEHNVIGHCFTAEKPEQVEGLDFFWAWGDELRKWQPGKDTKVYDSLLPAMRQGKHPQMLFTSTPWATPLIAYLDAEARKHQEMIAAGETVANRTIQRVWSTLENSANLPEAFLAKIMDKFGGSTAGRGVIYGELVLADPLAAWQQSLIDQHAKSVEEVPELELVAIAVDNATEDGDAEIDGATLEARNRSGGRADTGLILGGRCRLGHVYIFDDWTLSGSPDVWAERICQAIGEPVWLDQRADVAVIERNAGRSLINKVVRLQAGEMVRRGDLRIQPDALPLRWVESRQGKHVRADPVVTLYEQGRVHHVRFAGRAPLADLEFQMTKFRRGVKGWKKDRVDALVHLVTHLAVDVPISTKGQGRRSMWA